ncbi:hypothetical protein FisN_18Lh212 [Fistulifera solaris]|uniref:Uncharacterized protein n=1 Tax=Fistulifera solaris TaxID=1519565 RepID=A0A1Z5JUP3_FISSO|nr:hypothetical protein FisN_18Lh212 [Fistulifera solaris]|eukprot:GAX17562.1 hypothetical protein FisN_18Lh212 [Fistulifera solaris]
MTEPSRCSSRTESSIPRASSNLELLSQTAAWKNDLENPARVSPSTEIAAQTPSTDLVSPKHCHTVGSASPETSPSLSVGYTLDGRTASPFVSSLQSSSSWAEKWSSMMFPINNERSNSFEDKSQELPENTFPASSSSAFCRHPQAVHAAFAPPVSTGNTRKRSADESDSSNKRLVVSTSPDGSRVSVTTTTTTVIRQRGAAPLQPRFDGRSELHGHGRISSSSGSTTPPFVIEPGAARTGPWQTSWTSTPSVSNHQQVLDELARDNALLRYELGERNRLVETLQQAIEDLQAQVDELRQLPVGKISQIPVADMLELMHTYGSEVSDHTHLPVSPGSESKRKVQKASIVRQFRRWNPNFHEFFHFQEGKWVPKLGVKGELERRAQNRALRRLEKVAGSKSKADGEFKKRSASP